jgi:hypothetical protein
MEEVIVSYNNDEVLKGAYLGWTGYEIKAGSSCMWI